ncbi:MAG TPA: hypothetical protein VHI52_08500 [Verrucomicrobiae bacterium]|nr:hypothetical protein [Verrucomicrobiae bacterium]
MTKVISVLILAAALYGGWELFFYWEKVKNQEETQKKQDASEVTMGDSLPGMPYQLEPSLKAAQDRGAGGLKNWLDAYGTNVVDPRKAWIQLDYCILVSRENPAEARRVFAEVKARTAPTSPVWPRIKRLERTYQ